MALEGVADLGIQRPTVAHGVHRVVHDAMPGVVDKYEGPLLAIVPVRAHFALYSLEELTEVFMQQVFGEYDVVGVRAE